MTAPPPSPRTSLVILLGASEFPEYSGLSGGPTFGRSAKAVRDYLLSPTGFGLPVDNLLDLFNASEPSTNLDGRIADFLKTAGLRTSEDQLRDVILYYVGHGGFSESSEYFVAIRGTRKDNDYFTGYPIKMLANTLREHARQLRKFLVLDCCFSAAAYASFQASGPLEVAFQQTKGQFEDVEVPGRGTALLCAAGSRDPAKTVEDEEYTMFTGALITVVAQEGFDEPTALSLVQLRDRVYGVIKDRYKDEAVRPELHTPEQKYGDISKLPLFPLARSARLTGEGSAAEVYTFYSALEPATFRGTGEEIHCVVVLADVSHGATEFPLEQHVRLAWEHHGADIRRAVVRYRETYQSRTGVSPNEKREAGQPVTVLSTLPVAEAFRSAETLTLAVEAICKADVVVFDTTDFQPGVMFMLGIRAVARRGVTVCSLGGNYVLGSELRIPFNLQMLNLASHSELQADQGDDPLHLIGWKIAKGFQELRDLPSYLDLPAFDSIRQLGVKSASYRPVTYKEQVLFLCPFSQQYSTRNWNKFLSKELAGKLKTTLTAAGEVTAEPRLVRLLDLKTPRLVAQTLFESIRRTDMCIVDWTGLRANVLFEAGVRLASNPLGAVHIIETDETGKLQLSDNPAAHVKQMMALFPFVRYMCKPGVTEPYARMVRAYEASAKEGPQHAGNLVYPTVGASFDRDANPVDMPVVEELIRSANLLVGDEGESTGISSILYHDVNEALLADAENAAAERRLAAWLYLERRYPDSRLRWDPVLNPQFRTLGAQIRRWLKRQVDPDLDEYIQKRMNEVRQVAASVTEGEQQ